MVQKMKYVLPLVLGLGISACSGPKIVERRDYTMEKGTYTVSVADFGKGSAVSLTVTHPQYPRARINALDWDSDMRIDEVKVWAKPGTPLEELSIKDLSNMERELLSESKPRK